MGWATGFDAPTLTLPPFPPSCTQQDLSQAQQDMWMDWANGFDAPNAQCLYPILGLSKR